jgi:hypothetical protein
LLEEPSRLLIVFVLIAACHARPRLITIVKLACGGSQVKPG